jgi:hypothetical protein
MLKLSDPRSLDEFDAQFRRMLQDDEMVFLVAKIEPFERHPWKWEQRKPTDGVEDKYNFLRYIEKVERVVIHPGAAQNWEGAAFRKDNAAWACAFEVVVGPQQLALVLQLPQLRWGSWRLIWTWHGAGAAATYAQSAPAGYAPSPTS